MPTLHWIGKEKVVNHHLDVPFRVLQHGYGFHAGQGAGETPTASGNKIIHGDNLEALKSLLPEYEGKVKCIYIDPPYNTGNEGWVYNDNVNDPKIKKWLAQVVGKEGEDLSRHDKWLCMMYPRLKLLHKLLADDGLLFLNLDDNEAFNCKLILDEIYGPGNYLACISWEKRYTRSNNAKRFYSLKDTILVYRKTPLLDKIKERRTSKADSLYSNPDNDPRGPWITSSYVNPATKEQRPNLVYPIVRPVDGVSVTHETHAWKYEYQEHLRHVEEDRLWWTLSGKASRPRLKIFLSEASGGMVPVDLWKYDEVGSTDDGSNVLKAIFGKSIFDNPKPPSLIEKVLSLIPDNNAIILDSFAGSGTTAHAVLNLNQQDGGNRKFILIEMEDYADTITAERVKRVMDGYGEGKNAVPGTGGAFDYYTLGPRLFREDEQLNEAVGIPDMRAYIWYSETRSAFLEPGSEEPFFLGKLDATAYYFVYDPAAATSLDYTFLSTIHQQAGQYVIYADHCLLPADFMARRNIIFKKIPRDITRF